MRITGRDLKILVENTKRALMREFINNNVNAPWTSNVVSKKEIEDAINNEDRIDLIYTSKAKGEHERVFVPTSVMYSSTKNRYRVVGIDPNKNEKDGRVAFIINNISDWENIDQKLNRREETIDNTNDNGDVQAF